MTDFYKMFLDDVRDVSYVDMDPTDWVTVRSFDEAIEVIRERGAPSVISFDHDLGDYVPTGYDLVKELTIMDMDEDDDFEFPEDFKFSVHSMNPVGADNIRALMKNYLAFKRNNK